MPSNILREVELPILTDSECEANFANINQLKHVCAGEENGGKDTCQGDSGIIIRLFKINQYLAL